MPAPATPEMAPRATRVPGRWLHRAALALCCLGLQPLAAQEPETTPAAAPEASSAEVTPEQFDEAAAVIERLHGTLLSAMQKAAEMGYAGRYGAIEPVITDGFDTPLIVKVILSRHWTELSPEQQAAFVAQFRRLSVATYASRFNGYDRESFAEISREALNRGRLLIKTELTRPDKKPVRLDYLMHRAEDGKWRIISVIANGVNDLSLKRAEYAVVIKERGFDALVADIERKINEMESGVAAADAL